MPETKKSTLALFLALFGWGVCAGLVVCLFSSYRFGNAFLSDEPLQVVDRLEADDLQQPPPPPRSFHKDIEPRDTLFRDQVRPPAYTEVENPTTGAFSRRILLRLTPPTGPPQPSLI